MSDNIFIDTNILIYCFSTKEPTKQKEAQGIVDSEKVIISTQVVREFTNAMSRKFKIPWFQAEQSIIKIQEDFPIHVNKISTLRLGCKIANRYKFHFYDSLIIAAALETSCKTLYSEDMQHNQVIENQLTIINPFALT